jgi:hypothetical protein
MELDETRPLKRTLLNCRPAPAHPLRMCRAQAFVRKANQFVAISTHFVSTFLAASNDQDVLSFASMSAYV